MRKDTGKERITSIYFMVCSLLYTHFLRLFL